MIGFLTKYRLLFIAVLLNNILLLSLLYLLDRPAARSPLPEVEFDNKRLSTMAGNYPNRGTIRLYDKTNDDEGAPIKIPPLEIGFYRYGTGLFTDHRFEFWTGKSVSIANHLRTPNLEIRTKKDIGAGLWFNGAGELGTSLEELKVFVGGGNGDINDSLTSERTVNHEFQYIFDKNGTLHVTGDIVLNGKSLNEVLLALGEEK